ncbi:glycosyltransferase family 2 protein [Shewanella inventionis]|uniref:glycosyltransferase family 2 protein n=1 Tax=Shewanella inventionis TaxID=1738770 RepID=UPI001CBED133|nr:glycosyltransferase [Shewanella inventionis]UAL45120.1 glycosyltransferase family 2 protein [Shewanella inventionis]
MLISIIIPAYNEEALIADTLLNYCGLGKGVDIELLVICNGCVDKTYELSKNICSRLKIKNKVYDLPVGSKTAAINKGVEVSNGDYLLIQDADVVLTCEDIKNLVSEIDSQSVLTYASVKPLFVFDVKTSLLVKLYYGFLSKTPAFKKGMVSAGIYLVKRDCLKGIFPLPQVIADDGYIKASFGTEKLVLLSKVRTKVRVPKKFFDLIKIKTRSNFGNFQLKKEFNISPSGGDNSKLNILKIAYKERVVLSLFVYIFVVIISKFRAKIQLIVNKNKIGWERDESSRN